MHNRERRAGHLILRRRAQGRRNPLHQRRLPRPHLAPQNHHQPVLLLLEARRQHLRNPLSQLQRPLHRPRPEPPLLHPYPFFNKISVFSLFLCVLCDSLGYSLTPQIHVIPASFALYRNASAKCVTVSVARTVCSSIARAAKSPASPCKYTAASTALATSSGNCASIAATIPVRMSPLPPFAIAGFPLVFTATRPSGCATSVRHPFSTSVSLCSVANRRASPTRSASTSFTVIPASRAISPGCGVSTMVRPVPSSKSARPANAFSASASTTIASLQSATNPRTNSGVVPSRPNPGPTATTLIPFNIRSSRSFSIFATEAVPNPASAFPTAPTSRSATTINPVATRPTSLTISPGTAAVTSPAPARRAARLAIAGAPAFP